MLGKLIDVLIVVVAVAVLFKLGPDVVGIAKWRKRLRGRARDDSS